MKSERKTYGLFAVLFIMTSLAMGEIYFFSSSDLSLENMTSSLPHRVEWEVPPLNEADQLKLKAILNQTFTYLSEGGQSNVFSSADQRYVLKLFKFKRFRPSPLIHLVPNISLFRSYRDQHVAKRRKKLITAFTGHKLAYDLHLQESGLIFIQLNASHSQQLITLIDKRGVEHLINLENVSYILQEKGETLSATLSWLLDQGDLPSVKRRINQLFDLYLSEYLKGLHDLDHGVMHNIGCIGDRLIHLDVGKFVYDEQMQQPEIYQKNLIKIAAKVHLWIQQNYPQAFPELTEHMERKLSQMFGRKIFL